MPEYNNFHELFEAVRQHVHDTGHPVYCCDDPMARTIGFACSDCTTSETIWSIELRFIILIDHSSTLWTTLSSLAGRVQLAEELNREAHQPPPVLYDRNDYNYETGQLSPEEEVSQLENLWDSDGAATGLAEQTRRKIRDKEEYEARVHAKVPTRFERKDVI